jgi:Predicted metal-dependent hydrolase with the TIM-barrel fold
MNRICIAMMLLAAVTPMAGGAQMKPLEGVIDIHAHTAPDSVPRSIDAIDLARLAESRGMRAIVFKNHYEPTADLAYLVHKVVPGIQAFGGVDLNLSMGGMNPEAVEKMALTTGGLGKIVWMATFDTHAQVETSKEKRPYVEVARNGELLPETKAVIAMIAKYKLVLATGHNFPEEDLMLIREARRQGVAHIIVTHPMMSPIHMSIAQMKEAAGEGAYLEFVYNGLIGAYKEFDFADYAKAISAVGVEHCILSSDMGQPGNPVHPDGLQQFFDGLRGQGFTQAEIDRMSKVNPARLLGME